MNSIKEKISRREFMRKISAGAASFGFLENKLFHPGKALKTGNKEIIYRTLGRTGIRVPVVSMGVMNAREPGILKQSYAKGVRLFDTAGVYSKGENEKMVGRFVKESAIRDKVILMTKILHPVGVGMGRSEGPMTPEQVKKTFIKHVEDSLKRLQTDYIDILFYHAVDSPSRLHDRGVREALIKLKKEGKTRFLGVSTHSAILDKIVAASIFDTIMVQLNFIMAGDSEHLTAIRQAAAKGMGIIAMKTQGGNRLASGIMNHSAALKWVLRHEFIATAIPGYKTAAELNENFSVSYDLEYTGEERLFLGDKKIKMSANFCRLCGACRESCPSQVEIPSLMRVHMYAFGYGNMEQARSMYATIPCSSGLKKCLSCSECTARCRDTINIPVNIESLKTAHCII